MGQGHSTQQQDANESKEGPEKRDYYELLEVEQDASQEEIKKAYRKKALELHPDKNYGNVEATTKLFAEVQSAYEVLSDPQERSWYDSHRDAFLGNNGSAETTDYSYNTRMTTSAEVLKLFSRFSPQMEFSDSPSGFYGGLRDTFAQLASEEEMACRWENIEIIEYPSFGSRDDDLEVVRQFYAVWSSFSTKKSFSWKDTYRYSDAPDRRVRRLMEKENRRLREGAIREFNDAVRSLVAFVKKRDPRYKSYKETQSQQHEVLRQSAAAQATRSRAANQAKLRNHIVQEWAKSENLEANESESSESDDEHFECIVCNKTFKTQNQFQAHERSKKHLKAVKQLCWEMRLQDETLELNGGLGSYEDPVQKDDSLQNDSVTAICPTLEQNIGQSDIESNQEPGIITSPQVSGRKSDTTSSGGSKTTRAQTLSPDATLWSKDGSDYIARETLEDRLGLRDSHAPGEPEGDSLDELSERLSTSKLDPPRPSPTKIGKAKQKRAKKAQLEKEASTLKCTACNDSFSSRNQLFSHIKLDHTNNERKSHRN
ncbi:hypothetical protein P175DRAFT_0557153 [Aspergillus ochraceoroseus IBT 24754]|uniref:J domain-containing protein n=2 Tax=Aspergillus ochraceoroseus TaxID=138278 RepID=A0A2T5M119_9EURO|nr:uncharacterized protein P175DRAFT_0557153 [Aspergillus ochraceoroseus IBT 24754]PTU22231.1 hypothetical protein P175DRAFT_0557153 [Aspergillus ochraceoroseus IBT 24754]